MIVRIKPGVRIKGLSNEILLAVQIAASVFSQTEETMTITSVTDGKHKEGSLHYKGMAVDLRLPLPAARPQAIADLRLALGSNYDVIFEIDHIHIEYDPKEIK